MPQNGIRALTVAIGLMLASLASGAEPVDALGDPLPKGAKARLGTARGVAWGRRDIMALPPDYKSFVAVDQDKKIVTWDLETGRVLNRLPPDNPERTHPHLVAVSVDGKRLAIWDYGDLIVREIATGRQLLRLQPGPTGLTASSYAQHTLFSLSGDGKLLAIGNYRVARPKDDREPEAAVFVWDVEKNEQVAKLPVNQNGVLIPLLAQDGKTLATWSIESFSSVPSPPRKPGEPALAPPPRASLDPARVLRLWDVATGKEVTRIRMSQPRPHSVALSPDGATVAVSAREGLIERWDTRTGEPMLSLQTRDNRLHRLAFSPDGKTLAAAGVGGSVRRWANDNGRLLGETELPFGVSALGFVNNERVVAWRGGNTSAVAWEVPSGKLLTPHREQSTFFSIGFSAGGQEVLTTGHGTQLNRWDVATGKMIGSVSARPKRPPNGPAESVLATVVVSPDGTRVLSDFVRPFARPPVVFDPATGAELFVFPPAAKDTIVEYVRSADLSRVVALSTSTDPKVKTVECAVWDVDARKKIKELTLPAFNEFEDRLIHPRNPTGEPMAALSPDGSRLVTLGLEKAPLRVPGQPVKRPALMVTGWDLKTGKKLAVLHFSNDLNLHHTVAVASNRSAVYRGFSGPLRVFDFDRGEVFFELDNPQQQTMSAAPAFSPDGNTFAAAIAMKDGTFGVRVYDWQRGKVLHTFVGHAAPISCLAFSPDGKTLASGSHDTTVLLWDLSVIGK